MFYSWTGDPLIDGIIGIILEILREIIKYLKEIGLIDFFNEIIKGSWSIPHLEILTFLIVGLFVEKHYVGRVAIFTNFMALLIFFRENGIKSDWIVLYLGIGFFMSLFAILSYIIRIWIDENHHMPGYFYNFGFLYSSFFVAIIMAICNRTTLPNEIFLLIAIVGEVKILYCLFEK